MLKIEECKKILNAGTNKYSDEEVLIIREAITQFAMMDFSAFMHIKRNATNEKSDHLHKSIDRGSKGQRVQPKRPGRPPKKVLFGERD